MCRCDYTSQSWCHSPVYYDFPFLGIRRVYDATCYLCDKNFYTCGRHPDSPYKKITCAQCCRDKLGQDCPYYLHGLKAKQINAKAPTLHTDEAKVTDGNLFGMFPQIDPEGNSIGTGVQIDWMVGNLAWLKFSYYSAARPEGSNVKGLHRTQLMLSAFQVADLSFNHISGVKDKSTGQVIAQDPDQALSILGERLGFKISQADAEDYYKLNKLLNSKMKPADYDKLLDIYFKSLESTRADIPLDLQDYWIKNQDRLGLKGKFLPDNSNLTKYKKA
jgi:hypothetical protein